MNCDERMKERTEALKVALWLLSQLRKVMYVVWVRQII